MSAEAFKTSLQIQPRDLSILVGLFECRVMTLRQVALLHFEGKYEYAKKRLQKLKRAGLIRERKRRINEPSVLFLTRKAFDLLKRDGHLSKYPTLGVNSFEARASVSEFTLNHELQIMEVKAALFSALKTHPKFSFLEFSTWPVLNQFNTIRQGFPSDFLVKPDGFIRIHEKEEGTNGYIHDCFLEVDRSSEKQETLINRAQCYLDYYRTGGFAVRNGASREEFKLFPFRVLFVVKSAERRNNTAQGLIQANPPILSQVWLTTFAEVVSDPLSSIWTLPKDYREVLQGTPFDTDRVISDFVYRRQSEREVFVESRIQKRRLLEE